MFLSHLLIDTGDNPDRPRPGRLWLRNIYHVHQRLSMAFPVPSQVENDPHFLRPFQPTAFSGGRFLFRIDSGNGADVPRRSILVQSIKRPDWDYAFQNARMFLAAPPQVKPFDPAFEPGQAFRFRVLMNLSKKSKTSKDGSDLTTPRPGADSQGRPRTQSKRVSLSWDSHQDPELAIREWFDKKSARNGFTLSQFQLIYMGRVTGSKRAQSSESRSNRLTFQSALIEGTLSVSDSDTFSNAIRKGIGPAKAFGFGLLSVAPLR